jgi:hypothetical protein
MKDMPTLNEITQRRERVAVARCIAKNDRMPSQADVDAEIKRMFYEAAKGQKELPVPTAAEAGEWLKAQGLPVPPAENVER